ncbi:MAG: hypothetical protein PVG22_18300 [Chromatiales bacterium]|jgi:hypothetical protein
MNPEHPSPLPLRSADASRGICIDPQQVAPVLLAVSPCRSGSTVLLRVFGYSGVESHFQQLKNVLRWQMQGVDFTWSVPNGADLVFLKETLGPFTAEESRFNPLQALLDAGYPADRLRLLVIGREPIQTWASWCAYWSEEASIVNYITAYHTTDLVARQAQGLGMDTSYLVHESLRDHAVETVVRHLLGQLGIPYTPRAIGGWKELPGFGAPGSNIVLPHEPPAFVTPKVHDQAKQASGLEYACRKDLSPVTEHDHAMITDSGLFDIYRSWADGSACLLGEQ